MYIDPTTGNFPVNLGCPIDPKAQRLQMSAKYGYTESLLNECARIKLWSSVFARCFGYFSTLPEDIIQAFDQRWSTFILVKLTLDLIAFSIKDFLIPSGDEPVYHNFVIGSDHSVMSGLNLDVLKAKKSSRLELEEQGTMVAACGVMEGSISDL